MTEISIGRPFREVVGEGVRRVRETAGVRQDDVSRAARARGLAWSQSKVAALERGDKSVSVEELATLIMVLGDVCSRDVFLPELIDPNAVIRLAGTTVIGGYGLLLILAGKPLVSGPTTTEETLAFVDALAVPWWAASKRAKALGLDVSLPETILVRGEAEEKAARRLGEHASVIAALSLALWGRTLTEERDRIVSERYGDASPDRRRALRGRVTRQLVDQMREEIKRREPADQVTGNDVPRRWRKVSREDIDRSGGE